VDHEAHLSAEAPPSAGPRDRPRVAVADAASSLIEEQKVEEATGDVEPMSVAHEESPFESRRRRSRAAAFEVGAPKGACRARRSTPRYRST